MMTALQRKQEISLGVGDAALMLHSEPAAVLQSQSRGICLVFPRASFESSARHVEDAATRRISRRSEALQLLRSYLRALERSRLQGWTDAHETISRHIIDLVTLSLRPQPAFGDSSASAVVAARREAVLGYIDAHFDQPGLTAADVARGQGISLRYLQRLLETSGATFTARVNELRLHRALRLLTEAGNNVGRISDIALLVGFSDISHFNRLFRSRFGDTPRGVRGQSSRGNPQ